MPIWKQQLFSRLQAPADDGADLGGSDSGADTTAQDGAEAADDGAGDEDERQPAPSQLESMLDSMTDGSAPADASGQQDKPDDAAKPNGQEQPASNEKPDDDAEFLASLKSERSRNRFQALKQQATEAEARYKDIEEQVTSLQRSISDAGMDADQFAQTIQFAKLSNSQNPADLRVARDMLQEQMAAISLRLGEDAPGVDVLAQFPDLKQAVDTFEITRQAATELAKLRHAQAQQAQQMQVQQQNIQRQAMYQQTVQQASQSMDTYLQSRASEVDHAAKMKALHEHFADPARMQQFVSTHQPHQWAQAVAFMYDNIKVAQQPPARSQQPLRARAGILGTPDASAASPLDRLSQHMDSLNL